MRHREYRTENASTSREPMPTMGTPSTWASALAVETPTRSPVKRPGPRPTAIPPTCRSSISDQSRSWWSAGRTISEWALPQESRAEPMTPCSVPSATVVWGVEVSIATTSIGPPGSRRHPTDQGALQPLPPRDPGAVARHPEPPALIVRRAEPHLEVRGRQELLDHVSPLDEGHPRGVQQVLDAQVQDLLDPLQPVDVDVIHGDVALVLSHQDEGGRQHRLGHAEGPGRSLHEGRLAGSQLPREDHHVARSDEPGHGGGGVPGLLGRHGLQLQRGRGHRRSEQPQLLLHPGSGGAGLLQGRRHLAEVRPDGVHLPRCLTAAAEDGRGMERGDHHPPVQGVTLPRTREIAVGRWSMKRVAKLPKVTMTFGSTNRICSMRYGLQDSISSGSGSRFPGGLHMTTLQMRTSWRVNPISPRSVFRSCPAAPTNGRPCLSSWNPGPSPMNNRSASGLPSANATWVRPAESRHLVQVEATRASSSSSGFSEPPPHLTAFLTASARTSSAIRSRAGWATSAPPVARVKTVSPSHIVCAGLTALAMPSCAAVARSRHPCLLRTASVATTPSTVLAPGQAGTASGGGTSPTSGRPSSSTTAPKAFTTARAHTVAPPAEISAAPRPP